MAWDLDRIRALAEDESVDLPPISAAQAEWTVRFFEGVQRDLAALEKREREQHKQDRQQ